MSAEVRITSHVLDTRSEEVVFSNLLAFDGFRGRVVMSCEKDLSVVVHDYVE